MAAFPTTSELIAINPFEESLEWRTLISQFGDQAVEQRKQKWLFPKRRIKLIHKKITKTQARTLYDFYLARKGAYEAFNYFYPLSATYSGEYVGTGDDETAIFNLPCTGSSSRTVYVDSIEQQEGDDSGDDYSFTAEGGTDGADKIEFNVAPTNGEYITVDFTGYLKIRARFAEDNLTFQTFYNRLVDIGVELKGLLNQ